MVEAAADQHIAGKCTATASASWLDILKSRAKRENMHQKQETEIALSSTFILEQIVVFQQIVSLISIQID